VPDDGEDQYIVCAHPEHLGSDQCYWPPGTVVTWHQACQFPGLDPATVEADIARGINRWTEICGVVFQRVSSPSQARLAISSWRIDGPMNVLGETQLPCSRRADVQCWMHLDDKEPWNRGINLADVVCHEMGHGIGIGHAPQGSANVMAPIYKAGAAFGSFDRSQSTQRYGAVKPPAPPVDPPTVPPVDGSPWIARTTVVVGGKTLIIQINGIVAVAR
jgi:hypothetical protein